MATATVSGNPFQHSSARLPARVPPLFERVTHFIHVVLPQVFGDALRICASAFRFEVGVEPVVEHSSRLAPVTLATKVVNLVIPPGGNRAIGHIAHIRSLERYWCQLCQKAGTEKIHV